MIDINKSLKKEIAIRLGEQSKDLRGRRYKFARGEVAEIMWDDDVVEGAIRDAGLRESRVDLEDLRDEQLRVIAELESELEKPQL